LEKFGFLGSTAFAHLFGGRYDEASTWAEKAIHENPNFARLCLLPQQCLNGTNERGETVERLRQ
jgi:hypothetical protein